MELREANSANVLAQSNLETKKIDILHMTMPCTMAKVKLIRPRWIAESLLPTVTSKMLEDLTCLLANFTSTSLAITCALSA